MPGDSSAYGELRRPYTPMVHHTCGSNNAPTAWRCLRKVGSTFPAQPVATSPTRNKGPWVSGQFSPVKDIPPAPDLRSCKESSLVSIEKLHSVKRRHTHEVQRHSLVDPGKQLAMLRPGMESQGRARLSNGTLPHRCQSFPNSPDVKLSKHRSLCSQGKLRRGSSAPGGAVSTNLGASTSASYETDAGALVDEMRRWCELFRGSISTGNILEVHFQPGEIDEAGHGYGLIEGKSADVFVRLPLHSAVSPFVFSELFRIYAARRTVAVSMFVKKEAYNTRHPPHFRPT